ncbi:hypothetical protein [Nafulsella turpanensis]|uniref:hypothetical protein n=1 Tax=Nafulsella turpanensis TaxID=1265690 RepID=UPI00034670E7|nr:hypothetical protein [Nafulsella turpanensis]
MLFKQKPWEGMQVAEARLQLPCQLMMLCKILEVEPDQLIYDFLSTLAAESFGRKGETRKLLQDYFILCGYGQQHYTEADIRKMMEELQAIGTLWPEGAGRKVVDKHTRWRNMYHRYWYRKWYYKMRRKEVSPLHHK